MTARPPLGAQPGMAAGVAISLALHALLLFALRDAVPPARLAADRSAAVESIAVWLRPPEPAIAPPTPEPVAEAPLRPAQPRKAKQPRQRAQAPPNVIALPAPAPATAPEAHAAEPIPESAPRFDMEAARRLARQLASEPDPERTGTAVGQIPPKPLATETRAARAIASAKRRDCKDGLPGGLLGPLIILLDKKDSGCKW